MEPAWIEAVKDACRVSNNTRVIAAWCELPVQVVLAVLALLEAKGEITPCEP